jgi:Mrp family chromosome partitioning ATPase
MQTIDNKSEQLPTLRRAATPTDRMASEPLVESFRLLAMNIDRLLNEQPRRVIEVVSAYPRDGRSLAALALARALAELGQPVVLVDADPFGGGLNAGKSGARQPLEAPPGLSILSPGHNGFTSQVELMDEIHEQIAMAVKGGATVIVDTAACTLSSLAFRVAAWSTAAIYIARRRVGDLSLHAEIRGQLDLAGIQVLGVVFNEG